MPIDTERFEKTKFFNPAGARGKRIKFESVSMWRGNHSQCSVGHHDGECVAAGGWILHGGNFRVVPNLVPVSVETGAMSMVEYPGQKGKYPESSHSAKGMRMAEESVGIRPTAEVLAHVTERQVRAQKATLENRGAKYEEVERELAKYRERIAAANAPAGAPVKKAARGE